MLQTPPFLFVYKIHFLSTLLSISFTFLVLFFIKHVFILSNHYRLSKTICVLTIQ